MADVKKATELICVFTATPYPEFKGERTTRDKRILAGKDANKKAVKTLNKISMALPIPSTDQEAQDWYGRDLKALVILGVGQTSYSYGKVDAYVADLGNKAVDEAGLTELVVADMKASPKAPGAKSEVKAKAAKLDALTKEYDVSPEEIAAILAARKAKSTKSGK